MSLVLVLDLWKPDRGGLEAYADALVRALCAAGRAVTIVCARKEASVPAGVEVVELGGQGASFYARADEACARLRSAGVCIAAFRHPAGTADVFLPLGGLLLSSLEARRRMEPKLLAACGRLARGLSRRTAVYLRRERDFFEQACEASLVLVNSELVRDEIRKQYSTSKARLELVGLPVDFEHYCCPTAGERSAARRELGCDPRTERQPVILFVGHDTRRKGLPAARAVLRRLRKRKLDARLVLVGRGLERFDAAEEGLIARAQIADVLPLYHAADVLLAPSIEDNLSLCVLEALATGLPVVTTQQNGAAAYLSDRRVGRVVANPRDVSALDASALACLDRSMLSDEQRALRRAAIADCRAQRHFERVLAFFADREAAAS